MSSNSVEHKGEEEGWTVATKGKPRKEKKPEPKPQSNQRGPRAGGKASGKQRSASKSGAAKPAAKATSPTGAPASTQAPRPRAEAPKIAAPTASVVAAPVIAAPTAAPTPAPAVEERKEKPSTGVGGVPKAHLRELYPPIQPYNTGFLQVSKLHTIFYEEVGNPDGKPVVFLHGGPGGGLADYYRQFFNPKLYRVIMFDQRGCGKSTPSASLEENTTWDLVEDIEKLRKFFKIEKWVVFGGSWGSTLALAYAETYPDRVKALILRGIFALRLKELLWFYQEGASYLFPDAWEKYLAPIPPSERGNLMFAYHRRLTGNDEKVKLECAKAWSAWEMTTSRLYVDKSAVAKAEEDAKFSMAFARIECHYFVNAGFFKEDGELLLNAHKIANIPGVIVQGRYDVVCPAYTAWDLHKVWPKADFCLVHDAGHSAKEPGIVSELVKACDAFASL